MVRKQESLVKAQEAVVRDHHENGTQSPPVKSTAIKRTSRAGTNHGSDGDEIPREESVPRARSVMILDVIPPVSKTSTVELKHKLESDTERVGEDDEMAEEGEQLDYDPRMDSSSSTGKTLCISAIPDRRILNQSLFLQKECRTAFIPMRGIEGNFLIP